MYIIAEIGINANGDLKLAKDMISEARNCGADAVKFQKRSVDIVYTPEFLDSPRETPPGVLAKLPYGGITQREQKDALEFSWDEYDQIDEHCRLVGIDWFASAWDADSLWFLEQYQPPYHKIASPMVTHLSFLAEVAKVHRPVIMSTGMCTGQDTHRAIELFSRAGIELVLMHCVSIYPCPPRLCNLLEIQALKEHGYKVGYSGHESGIIPTLAAIVLGATFIERHFTLDRSMYGSDQSASMEPPGLKRIAEASHVIEECMLRQPQEVQPQEAINAVKMRYWEE